MIRRHVSFEDLDGNKIETDAYFHLNKMEATQLSQKKIEGLEYSDYLKKVADSQDARRMLDIFTDLVTISYGVKAPDGIGFIKKDVNGRPLGESFVTSPAFDSLFDAVLNDPNGLSEFFLGIFPKSISDKVKTKNTAPAVLPGN